jgi:tetratricopeptide (TPR) repeat protein
MKNAGRIFLSVVLILSTTFCFSQDYPITDSLKNNLANAKKAREKVIWLGELSSFYRGLNEDLCNQYSKEQIQVAELSRERDVMITALLMHANSFYNHGGMQENINKGKKYSLQALKLAKESQLPEYEAWGYLYAARGERNDGDADKALNYNNLALSIAAGSSNDSLKISAYNSLASTYLAKKEKLLSFRNYLQALNIAEAYGGFTQRKNCYENLANFYIGLENYERAKDYQFKLLQLTKRFRRPYDRLELYNDLGDTYAQSKNYEMAEAFYKKAMALSDTLSFSVFKINSYSRMINMYFISNQGQMALQYIRSNKELRDFIEKAGVQFYIDHALSVAYTQTAKYDSAIYYSRIAEPEFEKKTSQFNRYFFYTNVADLYERTGNYKKALEYWLKCKSIGEARGDIQILGTIANNLDSVYQKLGDFKNAYIYKAQYHKFKDSLQTLEAEKDLLALEVENENQRKIKEAEAAEAAKRERHNVQYMGITAGIGAVFIVLVMLGAFSVSKTTIRIIGFFAFIFLFEFIILIADHKIHDATHGEPWKILAIKILLISILLPLHHWLEEKVIHILTERKLIAVSGKSLMSKLTGKTQPVSE